MVITGVPIHVGRAIAIGNCRLYRKIAPWLIWHRCSRHYSYARWPGYCLTHAWPQQQVPGKKCDGAGRKAKCRFSEQIRTWGRSVAHIMPSKARSGIFLFRHCAALCYFCLRAFAEENVRFEFLGAFFADLPPCDGQGPFAQDPLLYVRVTMR